MIAGTFSFVLIVENVFAWPGVGNYAVQATNLGDDTTVSPVTLVLGAMYVIANIFVDLLQAMADPRIKTA